MNDPESLRQNHEHVLARIARACDAAGRARDSVRLLAVSKTFPATDVLALAACGQRAFGENYLQEALDKIAACRDERLPGSTGRSAPDVALAHARATAGATAGAQEPPGSPLEWHFIGPVQSNKTKPIAEHFAWLHSLDRAKIAHRLADQRPAHLGALQVCIQVNVSGEASKSGVAPADARTLAALCATLPMLRLRGLTAIPEPTDDEALQRRRFAQLRILHEEIRSRLAPEAAAGFDTLSMGMSGDLEAAIAEGATIVRIGTALFGRRQ